MGSGWTRSDLTEIVLGRALVTTEPVVSDRRALMWWRGSRTYALTSVTESRNNLTDADLPTLLNPMPTPADLAWLRGEETT